MEKLNNEQRKAIADILEKIGLGSGLAVFINTVILAKDSKLNICEIMAIAIMSLILLILSVFWRK